MTVLCRALRRARSPRGDQGVSLIEAVVAILIASTVFLSMAAASMAAVKATLNGRANQQVGDFLSQALEKNRAMGYSSLAMVSSDLAGDSAVSSCSGGQCYNGEAIVLNASGSVNPHIATVSLTQANNLSMKLFTYVTRPTDSFGADYKRVTVVAKWSTYGQPHTRSVSTLMTETQRGLPLPIFKAEIIGNSAFSVNPGATVTYLMRVSNQGARDRFNLTKSDSLSWSFYYDVNKNGSYSVGVDTPVSDTNGDGILDTGLLEPNTSINILALRTIPTTALAGTEATTFTYTSVAQPAAASAVKTVAVTTTIVIGAVTATPTPTTPTPTTTPPTPTPTASDCGAVSVPTASASSGNTVYRYFLQGGATNPLPMARAAGYTPTATTPSTTVLAAAGSQQWAYTVSNPRPTFAASSTATMSVWVSTAAASASLQVSVLTQTSAGAAIATMGTVTLTASPFSCSGYQEMVGSITLPSSLSQMPNSGQLVFQLTNGGSAPVTVAYDATLTGTPTGRYQSYLDVGSNR